MVPLQPADAVWTLAAVVGLGAVLVYYAAAWWLVARDRPTGPVIPTFSPPDNLPPPAIGYVLRMARDKADFTAAITDLAARGHLRIAQRNGGFVLQRVDGDAAPSPGREDARLLHDLFGARTSLVVEQANHKIFGRARKAFEQQLRKHYHRQLFARRDVLVLVGAAVSALAMACACYGFLRGDHRGVLLVAVVFGWPGMWAILMVLRYWWQVWRAHAPWWNVIPPSLGLAPPIALILTPFFYVFHERPDVAALVLLAFTGLYFGLNATFFDLLRTPTGAGRELQRQIAGFRMYLDTVEHDRLNAFYPPTGFADRPDRALAYAIGLKIHHQWGLKFDLALDGAARAEEGGDSLWRLRYRFPLSRA